MTKTVIRLLVTDLDGTLIGHSDERSLYPEFKELIDGLRETHGMLWLVCTGRNFASYRTFFRPMECAGLQPDVVTTGSACVYQRSHEEYRLKLLCGMSILVDIARSHIRARLLLKRMHHHLRATRHGVRKVLQLPDRFTLQFASEESAGEGLAWVKRAIHDCPALKVTLTGREINARQIPCRRGVMVRTLARRLGIGCDEILAVGDAKGDLGMLDRRVAVHTGCPLNADEAAQLGVRQARGHIASRFSLGGVMEVITATVEGAVSSEIPAEQPEAPRRRHRSRHGSATSHSREERHLARSYLLSAAILIITLIVFASFNILPFSGLFMKPVNWLFHLIQRVVCLVA